MIYLKENKINKFGNNKIYLKDKVIYQAVKTGSIEPQDNYILSTLTTTTLDILVKLFNNKIFFKSVVINDSINVDINSSDRYIFTTPGTYTIKYNLDETKTWFNSMFNGCFDLTSFDFTNAKTSQITDINSLFGNCYKLTDLNLSNFDTSNVTSMSGTFQGCEILKSLDLSHFNTSKVTDMTRLFSQCGAERLDLSNFDMTNVTDFDSMFYLSSVKYIRCKQAFKDWCITNQNTIKLPTTLREGGSGTWEIVE